jgi:peptidoglycan/xylan/chitin deacetylase (PgdA/CDA1 family)
LAEAPIPSPDADMNLRETARNIAYKSGAMDTFHRARHSDCLTVLMFHRVQPSFARERSQADPLYTVTPELLAGIVAFLKRNYAIVGAQDVLSSLKHETALPDRPALVTFDDGWRDNLEWALPVLRSLPWLLFVAADAVDADCWWQEVLLWALRSGRASYTELWEAAHTGQPDDGVDTQDVLALLLRYGALKAERRDSALRAHEDALRGRGDARQMLDADDLAVLRTEGVDIGAHGAAHLPLSRLDDAAGDLRRSRDVLQRFATVPAMSFPHGRYNGAAVDAARALGYSALFTSDAILNPCPDGWLQSDVIGRISLNPAAISGAKGELAPQRLAAKLYLRDIAVPAGEFA